jgi:predicted ATPase
MITELRLRNFKCFEELDLPLCPLTLLSGTNGAGKSTVLQALLLIRQSQLHGELTEGRIVFNGELLQLGSLGATLREDAPIGAAIEVAIRWDDGEELGFRLTEVAGVARTEVPTKLRELSERAPLSGCRYVSADRIGPKAAFGTSDVVVRTADDIGPRGEYVAHYLAVHGLAPIPIPALHFSGNEIGVDVGDAASVKLKDQVEAWLGLLVPGVRIAAEVDDLTDVARLAFKFPGVSGPSDERRPTHVGFGLTYALPILVAVLSAKPGSLVVIENPEAHLHPRAQRLLVHLFARAAKAGVQVVVETHSDHVLNGARIAVRRKLLEPDDVGVHFFAQGSERGAPQLLSPRIEPSGTLTDWPTGFFDEWDRALDDLLV